MNYFVKEDLERGPDGGAWKASGNLSGYIRIPEAFQGFSFIFVYLSILNCFVFFRSSLVNDPTKPPKYYPKECN